MNTNLKIAVAGSAVVLTVGYLALSKNATMEHLYKQYPEIDKKIAKKAYSKVLSLAMRGKVDVTNYSTEQFDNLFLQEVRRLTTEK